MRPLTKSSPKTLIAVCLVLFALPAIPQTVVAPGETIDVSIVNLDVVVTDKNGNHITGLPGSAFEVLEDGKPQPITNFSELRDGDIVTDALPAMMPVAGSGPAEAAAASQQQKRQHRVIQIFVDQLKLPHFKADPIFDGLKKLLRDVVAPGDVVMIASWNGRVTTRLNPTDDLGAISATLDTLAKESVGGQFDKINGIRTEVSERAQFVADAQGRLHSSLVGALPADDDTMLLDAAADIALHQMRQKITAIKAAVTSISAFEGRKIMILLTDRLGEYAGGDNFYATSAQLTPSDRRRYDTRPFTEEMTATANAAGVTIYPIYPEGMAWTFNNASVKGAVAESNFGRLSDQATDSNVLINEMASLTTIAGDTGGIAAAGPIDIVKMFPHLRDDLGSYYSLAYRMPSNRHGQSHAVTVTTTNRNYRVRSRRQFIEKSDDASMRDRVVANLLRPSPRSAIAVSVSAGTPVRTKKNAYSVPVVIKVPKASLTMVPGDGTNHGAFTVYVAAGRVLGYAGVVGTVNLPFTAKSETLSGVYEYRFDLVTDFATDKLSVGVIDDNSRESGFTRIDLPRTATWSIAQSR
jgi:VWFA-related protein